MNINLIQDLISKFLYLIFFVISVTKSKVIKLRNDEDNFYNLGKIINTIQNDNELVLTFVDTYYD